MNLGCLRMVCPPVGGKHEPALEAKQNGYKEPMPSTSEGKSEEIQRLRNEISHVVKQLQTLDALCGNQALTLGDIAVSVPDKQKDYEDDDADALDQEMDDKNLRAPRRSNSARELASNFFVMGSALGQTRPVQVTIWTCAMFGVVFVLLAAAFDLGADEHGSASGSPSASSSDLLDPHRLLGGSGSGSGSSEGSGGGDTILMIAFSLTSCGLIAFIVNMMQQPLILGYLLGGVLVGPIALNIVESHDAVSDLSSLGLIFLLFMIGLELDIAAMLAMGKAVILTGGLQFPVCFMIHYGIFMGLSAIGLTFGGGPYATMYVAMSTGISSTMIVAKLLAEKGTTSAKDGKLTIGILIFQDLWAIVVLAIQPNLASPEITGILKTFGMIILLVIIAFLYAKFVMPAVLFFASRRVELMLVLSLAWCFFVGCVASLPFIGLSMELAALIAGAAIATFPYSHEFNGKIKFIRDFFITLFFAALGMRIPVPTPMAVGLGVLVALIVMAVRWIGIFFITYPIDGDPKLAALATINLSEISEFALVIVSLGIGFEHCDEDTLTIVIWAFSFLAIGASYLIGFNLQIYKALAAVVNKIRGRTGEQEQVDGDDHHGQRDILLLGINRVGFVFIQECAAKSKELLKRLHVVDKNRDRIMPHLQKFDVTCGYGDVTSEDVLEEALHSPPAIVMSTVPTSQLRSMGETTFSNRSLLELMKKVWPEATYIVTAEDPMEARDLYDEGAHYVIRSAKLCAERLQQLISSYRPEDASGSELKTIFDSVKTTSDKDILQARKSYIAGANIWTKNIER